ncbi:MAG: hypothetical protein ACI9TY_001035 [Alphaproteobacteria bacterium]
MASESLVTTLEKADKQCGEYQKTPEDKLRKATQYAVHQMDYVDDPSLMEKAKRAIGQPHTKKNMPTEVMSMFDAQSIDEFDVSDEFKEQLKSEFGDDARADTISILQQNRLGELNGFKQVARSSLRSISVNHSEYVDPAQALQSIVDIEKIEETRPLNEALEEGPQTLETMVVREEQEQAPTIDHSLSQQIDRDDDNPTI